MSVVDVTVVIPTIPPRRAYLDRAVQSVMTQTAQPKDVSVSVDEVGLGASRNRNAAAHGATTEWLAFLDDDDEFLPHHLEILVAVAVERGADYVFGDFVIPQHPGFVLNSYCYGEFDPAQPLQTTITTVVKRSLFEDLGGFMEPDQMTLIHGDSIGEDYDFTKRCVAVGAEIHHVPMVTWYWHHHGGNTSGRVWNR